MLKKPYLNLGNFKDLCNIVAKNEIKFNCEGVSGLFCKDFVKKQNLYL
jgi:hypothetical protein